MMAAVGFFGIDDSHDYFAAYVTAVALMTVWIGAIAFFPALLAIALAEVFAWRSVIYYLLAGGAIGLAADPAFRDGHTTVMLASGFVGGFAYWLIAGRLAGPERSTEMDDGVRQEETGSGR
jgi:hypothetical protein